MSLNSCCCEWWWSNGLENNLLVQQQRKLGRSVSEPTELQQNTNCSSSTSPVSCQSFVFSCTRGWKMFKLIANLQVLTGQRKTSQYSPTNRQRHSFSFHNSPQAWCLSVAAETIHKNTRWTCKFQTNSCTTVPPNTPQKWRRNHSICREGCWRCDNQMRWGRKLSSAVWELHPSAAFFAVSSFSPNEGGDGGKTTSGLDSDSPPSSSPVEFKHKSCCLDSTRPKEKKRKRKILLNRLIWNCAE